MLKILLNAGLELVLVLLASIIVLSLGYAIWTAVVPTVSLITCAIVATPVLLLSILITVYFK